MERKLFKDTRLGTPQGGIISPLLANVYLHELDKYMERYTALSTKEKTARRREGQANYAYVRYADDFVILSNGTRAQAEAMREEVREFLATELHLTLSMEKTKITHLNDGFDFLGFRVQRAMGHNGMKTKVTISAKGVRRHLETIQKATAPQTHQDSVTTKLKALNRIIAGWCRYYQYTSRATTQFAELGNRTFWATAHWLGRKFRLSMPQVLKRFSRDGTLSDGDSTLVKHAAFQPRKYKERFLKPNPYTTQGKVEREELPNENPWTGFEDRPGWADIKRKVQERDNWTCGICKAAVTPETCQVDHLRPYSSFKRPVDANRLDNLWTVCIPCHRRKTERERQRESPVQ
jgi:hypothetical protein